MRYTCKECSKQIKKEPGAMTVSIGRNYNCEKCWKLFSYRKKGLPICSVYDIDWTLAFIDWDLDWDGPRVKYTGDEPVNTDVYAHLQEAMKRNHIIIILTGRKRKDYGNITYDWLKDHEIYYDELIMQEGSIAQKNHMFKDSALKEIKKRYHIYSVIDDNPKVHNVCKTLGINFIPVDRLWYINL